MDVVGGKVVVLVVAGGWGVGVGRGGGVGGGRSSRQVFTQPSKQQKPLSGQSEGEECDGVNIFLQEPACVSQAATPAG